MKGKIGSIKMESIKLRHVVLSLHSKIYMKVAGDSSHNFRYPQVKSQNPSRILHKAQRNTILVCAKLIHTNYGNPSGSKILFLRIIFYCNMHCDKDYA